MIKKLRKYLHTQIDKERLRSIHVYYHKIGYKVKPHEFERIKDYIELTTNYKASTIRLLFIYIKVRFNK